MHGKMRDVRTLAYVLRRTNYGEADRILNLITPEGKMSAIAKSVRKEKSRLAGNIEMFSLIDINLHFGKNDLAVVTGAKMVRFYSKILTDFNKMELAAMILKKISLGAESSDNPEFFQIVDQCLYALNDGVDVSIVEAWFCFNYAKAMGEQVNMYRDQAGDKLEANEKYVWDAHELVLMQNENGDIDGDIIKIVRLMLTSDIKIVMRIKNLDEKMPMILKIARSVNK